MVVFLIFSRLANSLVWSDFNVRSTIGIVVGIVVGELLDYYEKTEGVTLVEQMEDYYNSLLQRAGALYGALEIEILWTIWPHDMSPFPYRS